MKAIISSHNKRFSQKTPATPASTKQSTQQSQMCNCRRKPECSLEGKCLHENVVYQANVTTTTTTESYVGLATHFKERYRNHISSFSHTPKVEMRLNWANTYGPEKMQKKSFHVQWKVLRKCKPYDNVTKKCNLCLQEKFFIICRKDLCTLNKRNELASSFPHRNRFTLKTFRKT